MKQIEPTTQRANCFEITKTNTQINSQKRSSSVVQRASESWRNLGSNSAKKLEKISTKQAFKLEIEPQQVFLRQNLKNRTESVREYMRSCMYRRNGEERVGQDKSYCLEGVWVVK